MLRVKQIAVVTVLVLAFAGAGPLVDLWHHHGSRPFAGTPAAAAPVPTTPEPTVESAAAPPVRNASRRVSSTADTPVVYLTFDDGPDAAWTPRVLELLARYDAKATFFEIGAEAQRQPGVALAVRAAGHKVGSHTWDHPWLTRLTAGRISEQLDRTDTALGLRTRCLRPPGGFVDAKVRTVAAAAGKDIALWDDDTRDWARPGVDAIVTSALRTASTSGRIVLLHDGGGDRSQSVAALAKILPALAAKGYRFEPLPIC